MLGRLLILLSVLALVPVTAVADLASAQKLYEDGHADDALAEVDSLLASSPADPELRFLKGVIFAEHGKNDEAIEIFAALTRDYPELPEPYNNLAVLFAEKGEFEKAREALLAAIRTHPSYSTAHENLGDLYAKMASMAYDRALEEDKANESARIKLAQVNSLFSMPQSKTAANAANAAASAANAPAAAPAQAEAAPEQAAAPAAAAADPATNPSSEVEAAVERWRTAWTEGDVQAYVDAYADDYAPRGMTHDAWSAQRRERLTSASFVKISVDNLHVAFPGADTAKAEFTQGYQADNDKDRVRKTLTLSRTGSGWRIVQEDSQPL